MVRSHRRRKCTTAPAGPRRHGERTEQGPGQLREGKGQLPQGPAALSRHQRVSETTVRLSRRATGPDVPAFRPRVPTYPRFDRASCLGPRRGPAHFPSDRRKSSRASRRRHRHPRPLRAPTPPTAALFPLLLLLLLLFATRPTDAESFPPKRATPSPEDSPVQVRRRPVPRRARTSLPTASSRLRISYIFYPLD